MPSILGPQFIIKIQKIDDMWDLQVITIIVIKQEIRYKDTGICVLTMYVVNEISYFIYRGLLTLLFNPKTWLCASGEV